MLSWLNTPSNTHTGLIPPQSAHITDPNHRLTFWVLLISQIVECMLMCQILALNVVRINTSQEITNHDPYRILST